MGSISYKIKLKASINGVEKTPSKIAWVQGNDSCLLTPCYKENDYLVVELIPDCVGSNCIEGWVLFEDTCSNCEPIHFKKCFCSGPEDCADCEECNSQGVCESKCLAGEYCLDNSCVECDPNHPCKDGKICKDGKCVCPQGTFEKNGKCIGCDENTVLTKCQECRNGEIIEKVCDGKCDPSTGTCVDCLNSGDCANREDGKGCCDGDHNCICCRGTVWDPKLGKCIAQPCKDDLECGPCMICTPEGCKPMQCPDGYKCVNGECVYWPCLSTSCENGADCGPECGCVEFEGVKQCVPCAYLQCNGLCEQALGCKCSENNTCISSDNCSQVYCDNENPCQQPGCTCYEYTCVDCSNFPCTDGEGGCTSYEGCGCNDENKCEGTDGNCPNNGIVLEKIEECGTNEGCKLKVKIPKTSCKCDPIIFRTENTTEPRCDINLAYAFDQPIIPAEGTTPPASLASAILNLRVGMFKKVSNQEYPYADYKTNYNFSDNELVSGTIEVVIKHQVYVDGLLQPGIVSTTNSSISKTITNNLIGEIVLNTNHIKTVLNNKPTFVTVEVWAKSISIINANCIKYESPKLIAKYELDYKNVDATEKTCQAIKKYKEHQITIVNDDKSVKYPRLTWYRTSTSDYIGEYKYTGTYSEKGWFRKLFVKTLEGDFWVDYINKPSNDPNNTQYGELINNYNYIVKTDCSCGNTTATHQNTHFCCPNMLADKAEFFYCNKKLVLSDFTTCLPNGVVSTTSPYIIPTFSNVDFYLKVILNDGTVTNQKLNKSNTTVIGTTYEAPSGKKIAQAFVYQKYAGGLLDAQELCTINLNVQEPILPEIEKVIEGCDANLSTVTFKIKKITSGTYLTQSVQMISPIYTSSNFTENNGYYIFTVQKSNSNYSLPHKALVKFTNGCEKEVSLPRCSVSFDASSFN